MLDKIGNRKVVDFRLIYDADSELILDFYSDAIVKESSAILGYSKSYFYKIDTGLVAININDLSEYNDNLRSALNNTEHIFRILNSQMQSLLMLKQESLKFEQIMRSRLVDKNILSNYYRYIVNAMSYFRLEKFLVMEEVVDYTHPIPSHIFLLEDGLCLLMNKKITFEEFSYEYAYLYDFYIEPNILEDYSYVMNLIYKKQYKYRGITFEIDDSINFERAYDEIYYKMGWCEEFRRVLQQRTLRNLRELMHFHKLDIHLSNFNCVKKRITNYECL
jgi:hypothetical protein